jgi:hypothetical protein
MPMHHICSDVLDLHLNAQAGLGFLECTLGGCDGCLDRLKFDPVLSGFQVSIVNFILKLLKVINEMLRRSLCIEKSPQRSQTTLISRV